MANHKHVRLAFCASSLILSLLMSWGCIRRGQQELIVYASLDREFSEPIFAEFTKETGIHVRASYDSESTKTVQHVTNILAERQRPRCDLFWNNEILHTLRLRNEGLLATYVSPLGRDYPPEYRSSDGTWHGFAARARILIVNTELVRPEEMPTSIQDLVAPKWRNQVAIAKPLHGTTASHAACLFQVLGNARATEFFRELASTAQVMSGNKQVAIAVARGQLAFGLTDTDDAMVEIEKGYPVTIVYPDQGEGEMGTLFIPNTLAIVKGSANSQLAERLVDYLLSPAVETRLADGPSAQIPLNRNVNVSLRVETPSSIRPAEVDFESAAQQWGNVSGLLEEMFARTSRVSRNP